MIHHPGSRGQETLKITGSPAATPRNPAGLYKWAAKQAARVEDRRTGLWT